MPGTYERISTAPGSWSIAFVYSSLGRPAEVYLADSRKLNEARPITSFNKSLAAADLPQGKPYRWKADDGTQVEGMLIYPPGIDPNQLEKEKLPKNLPLFTFIHGGPADADGNRFEADWYQWSALAATQGWLVFEPNYRGSTGYGDKFLQQIVPTIVSPPRQRYPRRRRRPNQRRHRRSQPPNHRRLQLRRLHDHLANYPNHQIQRPLLQAPEAVEHLANWGNDDTTFDDALLPRRTPLGSPPALPRRSRHLPSRQSKNAHPHGGRSR